MAARLEGIGEAGPGRRGSSLALLSAGLVSMRLVFFLLAALPSALAGNISTARALASLSACKACDGYYCWSSSSCTSSLPTPPTCTYAQASIGGGGFLTTSSCAAGALASCSACTGAGNRWCSNEAFCVTPADAFFLQQP